MCLRPRRAPARIIPVCATSPVELAVCAAAPVGPYPENSSIRPPRPWHRSVRQRRKWADPAPSPIPALTMTRRGPIRRSSRSCAPRSHSTATNPDGPRSLPVVLPPLRRGLRSAPRATTSPVCGRERRREAPSRCPQPCLRPAVAHRHHADAHPGGPRRQVQPHAQTHHSHAYGGILAGGSGGSNGFSARSSLGTGSRLRLHDR